MVEWFFSAEAWLALATLTALEIHASLEGLEKNTDAGCCFTRKNVI